MKKNNLIKGLTLLCFVLLIGAFILYQTHTIGPGLSDNVMPALTNTLPEDTGKPVLKDTLGRPRDSARHVFMSSSKSIVLTEPRRKLDTLQRRREIDSAERRKLYMMSGSKSGRIIDPATTKRLTDSIRASKRDTLKH
ncbi:hypothetical protein HB364_26220 [Pseudoflavitalea sp. X16]|uniref:hypothetical protein n=1 Tax=Paraflavitalea devenefica TaxID=2716334 RepID=UPI0014228832|nr:hypothetical protein [Paraflavitalea devenefica]NII28607.1 hypothetical protein [Paraflavitalea devenefica]